MPATPGSKLQRPTSWASDLAKSNISRELSREQWSVIDGLLQQVKGQNTALEDITEAQFSHPEIDQALADMLVEIRSGRGAVVLQGFPVERYDLMDIQRIYLGIGRHFGTPNSQNTRGEIIGHVTDKRSGTFGQRNEKGETVLRGYENNSELELHSDTADIVGLLCVRKARSGGVSSIADALKVYEILARDFPADLALLEKGWPAHRRNEETPGQPKVTPYDVPVFGWKDGLLSCKKNTIAAYGSALEALGRGWLDDASVAALKRFDTVADRPEVKCDMQLEPGEALYLNNFEFLHARTNYVDWDDAAKRRLLLRLWLELDPPWSIDPHMLTFENPSGMKGIDRVPQ